MTTKKITVIGDGAMATVCAMLLDSKGHQVTMWGPFEEHVEATNRARENKRYLPGYPLPDSLKVTAVEAEAFAAKPDMIVSAIPTQFLRATWQRFVSHVPADVPIVSVTKGVENQTLLRPTQVIADTLGEDVDNPSRLVAALSGPSVADELARCLPATVCAACTDEAFAEQVQSLFTTSWFRVYTNTDLIGVEIAGATKNVIALAAGILDGLQAGNNAKSALLGRGLAEITRLGVTLGADQQTFFGLAGVGDLATTCFSPTGRNRSAGELLGQGKPLADVLDELPGVVEGVPTTRSVLEISKQAGIEMPITQAVHAVLFEDLDPLDAISQLMTRQPKREMVG